MASNYTSFEQWYRERYQKQYQLQAEELTDREIQEWSLFMGYKVTPFQIVRLKQEIAAKLEMEGHDNT